MQAFEDIERLARIVRGLAATVSIATAVSLPLGYFAVSYSNQSQFLQYNADITAERLAELAYVQGPAWRYANEYLIEVIT